MSNPVIFISGLNSERIRRVVYALKQDPEICRVFISAIQLVEDCHSLIVEEMQSIRNDMSYWERLAESGSWEIYFTRLHNGFYRKYLSHLALIKLLRLVPEDFHGTEDDDDDIERHLAVLHADFNCLANILASVNDAASHLKRIYLEISLSPSINPSPIEVFTTPGTPVSNRGKKSIEINRFASAEIAHCLRKLSRLFPSLPDDGSTLQSELYFDDNDDDEGILSSDGGSGSDSGNFVRTGGGISTKQPHISSLHLIAMFSATEKKITRVLQATNATKDYPVGITDTRARSPSSYERFWLRNVLLYGIVFFVGRQIMKRSNDGSLKVILENFKVFVVTSVREKIVEPITKLGEELFETIHRREMVVSREELQMSRDALKRMLEEYNRTLTQPIIPKLQFDMINPFRSDTDGKGGSSASSSSSTSTGASNGNATGTTTSSNKPTISSTTTTDPSSSSSSCPEESVLMENLMRAYEKQLQSPMLGAIFGSLLTSMLIQVQKLKVHTEAAMLTMDQILASNELTMAGTAAMPAFLVLTSIVAVGRYFLAPRAAADPGKAALKLRLIMTDVERSLQEVYNSSYEPSKAWISAADVNDNDNFSNHRDDDYENNNYDGSNSNSNSAGAGAGNGGIPSVSVNPPQWDAYVRTVHKIEPPVSIINEGLAAIRNTLSFSSRGWTSTNTPTTPTGGSSSFPPNEPTDTPAGTGGTGAVGEGALRASSFSSQSLEDHELPSLAAEASRKDSIILEVPGEEDDEVEKEVEKEGEDEGEKEEEKEDVIVSSAFNSLSSSPRILAARRQHQGKQQLPPLRNISDRPTAAISAPASPTAMSQMVCKGVLIFHLHCLRDEVGRMFSPKFWPIKKRKLTFKSAFFGSSHRSSLPHVSHPLFPSISFKSDHSEVSNNDNNGNDDSSSSSPPGDRSPTPAPTTRPIKASSKSVSWSVLDQLRRRNQRHSRPPPNILSNIVFGQIESHASKEYVSITADIAVLLSPDFEVQGTRKIATAKRMRVSYRCLIPY